MARFYSPVVGEVSAPLPLTEYEVEIPLGAEEVLLRPDEDSLPWRWSNVQGVVASGGGMPMGAGESLSFGGPMNATTLYVAHQSSSGATKMVYAYNI